MGLLFFSGIVMTAHLYKLPAASDIERGFATTLVTDSRATWLRLPILRDVGQDYRHDRC
jgi:hypothetical protein